jgi:hypothetical protein
MTTALVHRWLGTAIAVTLAGAAFALPIVAADTFVALAIVVDAIVAAAASFAIATAIGTASRRVTVDTAVVFTAALLLAGSVTVTANPQAPVVWIVTALVAASLYAVMTRLRATLPAALVRSALAVTITAWVWESTPVSDAGSTLLGLAALAAPGLTLHAITSRQRRDVITALVSWSAVVLFTGRIVAEAQAVYAKEMVARETLESIPAFVSTEMVPVIDAVNTAPYVMTVIAAAVLGVTAVAIGRFRSGRSVRAVSVVAVVIAAVMTTTGLTQAAAEIPVKKASGLLENTIANRASMLSEAGAGPKDRYRGYSFEDCDAANNRDCFITYFDNIALQQGVVPTVRLIVDLVKDNVGASFPAHCHQVIHNLGQMAMDLTGGDFSRVSDIDPQVCGTGFTHGLWELNFNRIGKEAMFTKTGTICEELGMVNDWYRWTCSHILGHMMMTESMKNPALAMEYCLKITDPINRPDCLAGGWMNFFQDDYVLDFFRSGKGSPEDLFEICYGAKVGVVKMFCYQELFPVIYAIAGGDDYAAGKMCVDLAEAPAGEGRLWDIKTLNFADRCAQGLARAVAVSSQYDYRLIPSRCNAMPKEVRAPCLASAAASVVLNTGSQSGGVKVCDTVVDDLYRAYCVFWAKNSQRLLAQGPNAARDLPRDNETRLPGLGGGIPGSDAEPAPARP